MSIEHRVIDDEGNEVARLRVSGDEAQDIVDASGLAVQPLGEEWPRYAHPTRPEFLLTLPHRDRTSGFFVARLTA